MIKYAEPKLYFKKKSAELSAVLLQVIESGNYILGTQLEKFERSFAGFSHTDHCIGLNSATDAIGLSLKALGVGTGDKVITTAITAPATIISIIQTGAEPVIVDVEAPTYCISARAIEEALDKKTKAILPVHLHGFAANMDQISRICQINGLALVEDCAQAHGTLFNQKPVGSFGATGAFSFYPTKNLGCIGDGGAIITNNPTIYKFIKQQRHYGFDENQSIYLPGINSRMDELQAAFLNAMLPDLAARNLRRFQYAIKYHELLAPFKAFLPPLIEGATYHQFPIRIPNRRKFIKSALSRGLQLGSHYPYTMKDHLAFRDYCLDIPLAEKVVKEWVSIPIQPEILDQNFEEITNILITCLKEQ